MRKSTFQVYLHANIGIRQKQKKTYQISKHCRFRVWRESGEKFQFFFINEKPSTEFKFFFTSPEWCWLVPTFHLCYEKWMFRLRVVKLVLMVFFLQHLNLLLVRLFAADASAASQTSIYCYTKWTLEIVLIPFPFFLLIFIVDSLYSYISTSNKCDMSLMHRNVRLFGWKNVCARRWKVSANKKAETMNFSLCSNK